MTLDRTALTARCLEAGFHVVRFADVGPTPHGDAFTRWLARGHHGGMSWLDRDPGVRLDPRARLPSARTAIALAVQHHHRRPPDPGGPTGLVARYAWGRDYHNLVGKRLERLSRRLRAEGVRCWGGVDTAPILERSWATAAGLGFTGKSGLSILPARTSWLLLAVLFVDVAVAPDPPLGDHCGRCARCLDACPTGAFLGPRDLDARRCISYWTIEDRGLAPRALRPAFGRWVFGCDVCQEVCPHNAAAPDPDEDDLRPRHAFLDLPALLDTPDDTLDARFLGTPLRRPRPWGLKRNALIALGNLGDPAVTPAVRRAAEHPHEVVRAAATWCLARLGERVPDDDPSPLVRAELDAIAAGEVGPPDAPAPRG